MCGIVGVVNLDREPVDPRLLTRMRDSMLHRGPDDAGEWNEDGVGLGHRRLSILDLSPAGHQPMTIDDGSLWLVFNGEIFNYVELTAELEALGHRFRSRSDSEVILHAYQQYGSDCLSKFNGMFAFATWDKRRRTLFAARDRLGIKPFYYHWSGRRLIFASEIKAILAHPGVRREADTIAIADYLFSGQALAGRTMFDGISELLPGHALELADGTLRVWSYWSLEYDYDRARSDEDLIEQTAALIDDAVRVHCRSDASLGCHLSGGLDSSTVACLTTKHRAQVKSFSIRSPGGAFFDETPYAKAVSRHAGTEYLEGVADADDVARLMPKLVWHMDQPMAVPGGINYYQVAQLAAHHVKVSLTGHGGDEVFAGYPAQFRVAFGNTAMFDSSGEPERPEMTIWYRIRSRLRREGLTGLLSRVRHRVQPPTTPEALWVRMHCAPPAEDRPHLNRGFVDRLQGYSPESDYLDAFRNAQTDELLDRCLHHDLRCYLPSLLHMEDRVSMAVSLESRVPLLDYRLVELMATVPPEQKVRDRVPKRLLRDAGSRWLPNEVLARRDKAGFAMPIPNWFEGELAEDLRRVFNSKSSRDRGIFDPHVMGDRNFLVSDGWKALNLELWFRIYIDGDLDPTVTLSEIE
jgi:asparagine synthase (glutamine-hydrolysing)